MESLATYRLVPLEEAPRLDGKTHFFWASASIFQRALELAPSIISGQHACGPGHSYELISAELQRKLPNKTPRLEIFLSRESWLNQVCGLDHK
jgi:hydroxymethylbilane synthase